MEYKKMVTPTINLQGEVFTEQDLRTTRLVVSHMLISDGARNNIKNKLDSLILKLIESKGE